MKKVLLLAALFQLAACTPSPEEKVREAILTSTEVLVPASVELRELTDDGSTICGKISHESSQGRTEFQPFFLQAGKLEIITADDYLPGKEGSRLFYEETCTTNQPAQS